METTLLPHDIGLGTRLQDDEIGVVGTPDERWVKHKSAYDRYEAGDMFSEQVLRKIHQRLIRRKIWRTTKISVSVLSFVLFCASLILLILGHKAPLYQGNNEREILLYILSLFGWSRYLTGNNYFLTSLMTLLVALLSQFSVSRDLRREEKEFVRIITDLRRTFSDSHQVFVGSGLLRFSIGDLGLQVKGGNLTLHVSWGAVELAVLIRRKGLTTEWAVPLESATHMIIEFKTANTDSVGEKDSERRKINSDDYIVIPEHFFRAPVDATSWPKFVEGVGQYALVVTA